MIKNVEDEIEIVLIARDDFQNLGFLDGKSISLKLCKNANFISRFGLFKRTSDKHFFKLITPRILESKELTKFY